MRIADQAVWRQRAYGGDMLTHEHANTQAQKMHMNVRSIWAHWHWTGAQFRWGPTGLPGLAVQRFWRIKLWLLSLWPDGLTSTPCHQSFANTHAHTRIRTLDWRSSLLHFLPSDWPQLKQLNCGTGHKPVLWDKRAGGSEGRQMLELHACMHTHTKLIAFAFLPVRIKISE